VVRAKLPPLAFSIYPSSILANHLDPQSRTKDDDEEEEDWDMAPNTYLTPEISPYDEALQGRQKTDRQ